jgi:hypothetical protein
MEKRDYYEVLEMTEMLLVRTSKPLIENGNEISS